jgi:O-antigen/teichoic acid export membrane protein
MERPDRADTWSPDRARRKLVLGGAWSFVTWILSLTLGVPLSVALVRLMSARQYGALALATAIGGLVTPIAGVGLAASVASLAAAAGAHDAGELETVGRSALKIVGLATVAVALLSMCILALLLGSPTLRPAAMPFAAILAGLLMAPIREASAGMLQAAFDPVRPFVAGLVTSVAIGGLTVGALVSDHKSAVTIAAVRTVGLVVGTVVLVSGVAWRRRGSEPRAGSAGPRSVLAFGMVLLLSSSLSQAFTYLDVVFLGALRGTAAVAFYAPLSSLAAAIMVVAAVLGAYVLPALSAALARGDIVDAGRLYRWASRWAATVAGPMAVVLLVFPHALLSSLFGGRSATLIDPARILAIGVIINIIFGYNWIVLAAGGHRREILFTSVLGIGVSVAACPLFVWRSGAVGAAEATSISLVVTNLVVSAQLVRLDRIQPLDGPFALTLMGLAIGGTISWLVRDVFSSGSILQVTSALLAITGITVLSSLIGGGKSDRDLALEVVRRASRPVRRLVAHGKMWLPIER